MLGTRGHAPWAGKQRRKSDVHVQYYAIKTDFKCYRLIRVISRGPTMTHLSRLVCCRLHLGGREKLESRYRLGSRYGLGRLQFHHGDGILHSRTEASKDADLLWLLRTETDHYLRIRGER